MFAHVEQKQKQKQKQVRQWAGIMLISLVSYYRTCLCVLREKKLSDVSDEVCWLGIERVAAATANLF